MSNTYLGVGSPIDERVAKQFETREKLLGKTFRDKDTLLFLNSNTPWVRLSSGVNTLSKAELEALEESGRLVHQVGSVELAKQGVLGPITTVGGYSKELHNPLRRDGSVVESAPLTGAKNTYRNNESIGFRPAPGITSATVRSKGSYGTLRESTVNFIVWSVEDLNLVEALYLRPGFTVLLEWGHTLYFNNSEEIQKLPKRFPDFFTKLEPSEVEEELEKLRESADYNYDAVFGYVKNFNWSFRQDGGYDCNISIVSIGSLIESLRVDRSPMDFLPADEFAREGRDEYKEQQKSIFHYYISKLDKADKGGEKFFTFEALKESKILPDEFIDRLQPFDTYCYKADHKVGWWRADTYFWYFPLYHILDLYNQFIGKTNDGVQRVKFYTGKGESTKVFSRPTKLTTNRLHFTLDPGICILPEAPSTSLLVEQKFISKNDKTRVAANTDERFQFLPSLIALQFLITKTSYRLRRGELDDILNIQVTSKLLKEVADAFVNSETNNSRNSLSFIEDILTRINDNLGGVSELGLHEEAGIYYIVDRKRTPSAADSSQYSKLTLTGKETTLTSLQLTSKLSNQVGSQIAIAAQGLQGNYSNNISELLTWNKGLVDRHIKPPEPPAFSRDTVEQERKKLEEEVKKKDVEWFKDLLKVYAKYYRRKYESTSFEELKPRFRDIMARILGKAQLEAGTDEVITEKGIIPIELSFTTIGLSGLRIGQAFKVKRGVLPSNYADRFGFIITGIEHQISDKWTTGIKTQFYSLDSTPQKTDSSKSSSTETAPAAATGTVGCTEAAKDRLTTNFTLDMLSCNAEVSKASIPQPSGVKRHPVYGDLTGQEIRRNLSLLAVNVLEGIRVLYPDMTVTSGYRNNGDGSQHEAGMAADIQFRDLRKLPIADQNRIILERAETIRTRLTGRFDEFLLEYKTVGTRQPWLHISHRSGANRGIYRTFLNDKVASNGTGRFFNPLA